MNAAIDPALNEYDRLGRIVRDGDRQVPSAPTPPRRPSRATRRRAAARSRRISRAVRLLGAALAVILGLVATACDESALPTLSPRPGVAFVSLFPTEPTLAVGETLALTVTLRDAAGTPVTGRTLAWGSEGASVATVDANGRVTAVAPGVVRVFATSEGKRGTTTISVVAARPGVETVTVAASAGRPREGRASGGVHEVRAPGARGRCVAHLADHGGGRTRRATSAD